MKKYILMVCLSMLVGCATSYKSNSGSITGGYYFEEVNAKVKKVFFSGNGYLKDVDAQRYALYSSAEYAYKNNKKYFVIYTSLEEIVRDIPANRAVYGHIGGMPLAYGYIVLLDEKRNDALSVKEIFEQMDKEGVKRNGI